MSRRERLKTTIVTCLQAKGARKADSRHPQAHHATAKVIVAKCRSALQVAAHGHWKVPWCIGRRLRQKIMGGAELVDACFRPVTTIFPNICPLFLDKLAIDLDFDTNAIINYIVDQEGEGKPYPRKQAPGLKRKRESLAEEAQEVARVKRIYDAEGRRPRILSQHHARQM